MTSAQRHFGYWGHLENESVMQFLSVSQMNELRISKNPNPCEFQRKRKNCMVKELGNVRSGLVAWLQMQQPSSPIGGLAL